MLLQFLWQSAAAAVGFVIAKLGTAFLESRFSHGRFIEQERTDDVAEVDRRLERVQSLGFELWLRDHDPDEDPLTEALISSELRLIGRIIDELFANHDDLKSACTLELNRLDDALTTGNFGTIGRTKEKARLPRIAEGALDTARKVRTCRRKIKPSWIGRY